MSYVSAPKATADGLGLDRANCKQMLKNVTSDVQKNFYDEKLKGLDWNAVVEEAKTKIDKANNIGDMLAAIYVALDKLHDSHYEVSAAAPQHEVVLRVRGQSYRR